MRKHTQGRPDRKPETQEYAGESFSSFLLKKKTSAFNQPFFNTSFVHIFTTALSF